MRFRRGNCRNCHRIRFRHKLCPRNRVRRRTAHPHRTLRSHHTPGCNCPRNHHRRTRDPRSPRCRRQRSGWSSCCRWAFLAWCSPHRRCLRSHRCRTARQAGSRARTRMQCHSCCRWRSTHTCHTSLRTHRHRTPCPCNQGGTRSFPQACMPRPPCSRRSCHRNRRHRTRCSRTREHTRSDPWHCSSVRTRIRHSDHRNRRHRRQHPRSWVCMRQECTAQGLRRTARSHHTRRNFPHSHRCHTCGPRSSARTLRRPGSRGIGADAPRRSRRAERQVASFADRLHEAESSTRSPRCPLRCPG